MPDPRLPARSFTYLGDAVYASFDGYHIWLGLNSHTNQQIALEPAVVRELCVYAKRLGFPCE